MREEIDDQERLVVGFILETRLSAALQVFFEAGKVPPTGAIDFEGVVPGSKLTLQVEDMPRYVRGDGSGEIVSISRATATMLSASGPIPSASHHQILEAQMSSVQEFERWVGRVVRFFRIVARNGWLVEPTLWEIECTGWLMNSGKIERPSIFQISGSWDFRHSRQILGPKGIEILADYLVTPREFDLWETILSDAYAALRSKNLRRAIVEAATAVEVLVKGSYFPDLELSGKALAFLEDKNMISRLKVVEMLGKMAQAVQGRSFKDDHPDEFLLIDKLFRARNQAAHKGGVSFLDDSGNRVQVTQALAASMIEAGERVAAWIAERPISAGGEGSSSQADGGVPSSPS